MRVVTVVTVSTRSLSNSQTLLWVGVGMRIYLAKPIALYSTLLRACDLPTCTYATNATIITATDRSILRQSFYPWRLAFIFHFS